MDQKLLGCTLRASIGLDLQCLEQFGYSALQGFFATESIHVYLPTPLQPSPQAQAWMISLKGPSRISKDSRSKTKHFAVLDFTSRHNTISATWDRFMPLKQQNFRLSFGRAAITVAPRFSFSSRACLNTPFKSSGLSRKPLPPLHESTNRDW